MSEAEARQAVRAILERVRAVSWGLTSTELDETTTTIVRRLSVPVNGETSDGFHTFNELYRHRTVLFAALARVFQDLSWRAREHHAGGDPMFEGFFIAGMNLPTGQISYHVELEHWDLFEGVRTPGRAPAWDGHTSAAVVDRLVAWLLGCHRMKLSTRVEEVPGQGSLLEAGERTEDQQLTEYPGGVEHPA